MEILIQAIFILFMSTLIAIVIALGQVAYLTFMTGISAVDLPKHYIRSIRSTAFLIIIGCNIVLALYTWLPTI